MFKSKKYLGTKWEKCLICSMLISLIYETLIVSGFNHQLKLFFLDKI